MSRSFRRFVFGSIPFYLPGAIVGLVCGVIAGPLSVDYGPGGFILTSVFLTAASTVLSHLMCRSLYLPKSNIGVSLVACIVTAVFGFWNISSNAPAVLKMAPAVRSYGVTNFSRLDGDRNGILDKSELPGARSQTEAELLAFIRSNYTDIGHVTNSYYDIVTETMKYEYGISLSDFESYERRMNERYSRWHKH